MSGKEIPVTKGNRARGVRVAVPGIPVTKGNRAWTWELTMVLVQVQTREPEVWYPQNSCPATANTKEDRAYMW